MPKKTKDVTINKIEELNQVSKNIDKHSDSSVKKTSTSKKSVDKTLTTNSKPKKTIAKKSTSSKKASTKSKNTASKKSSLQNKKTNSKTISNKTTKTMSTLEYYDLPYRYNETVVKILAQTPKKLFIYWDISDEDRKSYVDKFGNDFFNNTVPILIVHNTSMNYTFEVEINDFANCWYLDINDTKCDYTIELGRRSKISTYYLPNNYIYVASSNKIESPNDHILLEQQSKTIYFRNVKNNNTHTKDIANISFIERMGKVYSIYDAYKKIYTQMYDDKDFITNPTSTFK